MLTPYQIWGWQPFSFVEQSLIFYLFSVYNMLREGVYGNIKDAHRQDDESQEFSAGQKFHNGGVHRD